MDRLKGWLLTLMLLAPLAQAEEVERLKLLCNQYPPFSMSISGKNFARDDEIDGINADIVRELMDRADIPYQLTMRFPYQRLLENAATQPNTGVFTVNRSAEREDRYHWVGPISNHRWVLVNTGPYRPLNTLEEAKGKRLVVQQGETISEQLRQQGHRVQEVTSAQSAMKMLELGQADYWVTAERPAHHLAQLEGVDVKISLRLGTTPLYLALNKQIPEKTVVRLQRALISMLNDNSLESIHELYR